MKTKKNNKIFLQNKTNGGPNQGLNKAKGKKDASKRAGSMLTIPTYTRKNLKLTNNVASLVKKYAAYIFN
jgi:hypothetical protein